MYTDQNYRSEGSVCVYLCLSNNKKSRTSGPCNSQCHAISKIFFGSLFDTKSKGTTFVLLGEGSGKNLTTKK